MLENALNYFRYRWMITNDGDGYFSLYRRGFLIWDFVTYSHSKECLLKIIEEKSYREYHR